MELPRNLRTVNGSRELAAAVSEVATDLGLTQLCLVSGASATRSAAAALGDALGSLAACTLEVPDNGRATVDALTDAPELSSADAVVAIGGGKTIDVAKLVCEAVDLPVIAVPTQLTADGIASPVSVIRDPQGHVQSCPARLPIAVLADLELIAEAPVESVRAGVGDLLANPSALRDWRLAAQAGREQVDDFAALLAQTASDVVYASDVSALGQGRPGADFLGRLLEGLVLSGLAMEIAGSSRPCSGSEHLFSHALDRLFPGTAMHGEQVAFGTLVTTALQGEDWQALQTFLRAAGMGRAAQGFDLTDEQIAAAFDLAPSTRPDRYTVLDEIDDAGRLAAVRTIRQAP